MSSHKFVRISHKDEKETSEWGHFNSGNLEISACHCKINRNICHMEEENPGEEIKSWFNEKTIPIVWIKVVGLESATFGWSLELKPKYFLLHIPAWNRNYDCLIHRTLLRNVRLNHRIRSHRQARLLPYPRQGIVDRRKWPNRLLNPADGALLHTPNHLVSGMFQRFTGC